MIEYRSPGVLLLFPKPITPILHRSSIPRLQISFVLIILRRTRMERHLERAFFRAATEISHVQRLIIVDRDHALFFVDGFDRGISNAVRQPAMRDQCPAAVIE